MGMRNKKRQLAWMGLLLACLIFSPVGRAHTAILFGGDWPFPLSLTPLQRSCLVGRWIVASGDEAQVSQALSLTITEYSHAYFLVDLYSGDQLLGSGWIRSHGPTYVGSVTGNNGSTWQIQLALLNAEDGNQLWVWMKKDNEFIELHPLYRMR